MFPIPEPVQDGKDAPQGFEGLSDIDFAVASLSRRPRWPVYAATLVVAAVGWALLASMSVAVESVDAPSWLPVGTIPPWLIAICSPSSPGMLSLSLLGAAFIMWVAMSVAMMLPSAAPMLRTYGEIADTAAKGGQHAVPLTVLAAGYLSAWAVFALAATIVQLGLVAATDAPSLADPVEGLIAGAILLAAGAYQFSNLREACLEKCRNPFTTLFARWSDRPSRIFRLGAEQGLFCIGCCWALMLVMLVVGTMNLLWMALLTLFAVLEKSGSGKASSRLSGVILCIWGSALIALEAFRF